MSHRLTDHLTDRRDLRDTRNRVAVAVKTPVVTLGLLVRGRRVSLIVRALQAVDEMRTGPVVGVRMTDLVVEVVRDQRMMIVSVHLLRAVKLTTQAENENDLCHLNSHLLSRK